MNPNKSHEDQTEHKEPDPGFLSGWTRWLTEILFHGNPRPRLYELLALKGDEVLVDAGSGSGAYTIPLARKLSGGKVIAVDLSRPMLDHLEKQVRRKQLLDRVEIHQGDCTALPVADASSNRALTVLVWHHMSDPEKVGAAAAELNRVLKPGGKVLVADWLRKDGDFLHKHHSHHGERHLGTGENFGEKEMKDILEEAGFVDVGAEIRKTLVLGYGRKP